MVCLFFKIFSDLSCMMGVTSGAGTAYLSLVFSRVRVARSLVFCVVFYKIVVCPFVLFLLAIVLSVLLQFMDSDYPFGIFKLFWLYSR